MAYIITCSTLKNLSKTGSKVAGAFPLDPFLVSHRITQSSLTFKPKTTLIGDCVIELRMAKDFGDDVLPLRNQGYFPGSSRQLVEEHDWPDIINQCESLMSNCVWGSHLTGPGWARAGNNMIVLLLPTNSEMRKRWLPNEKTLAAVNSSGYLAIT